MASKSRKVKKAIVLAGGKGTRFLPITTSLPKEMFPLVDRPVIQYVLEECLVEGIEEIIFIISKEKNVLTDYLANTNDADFKRLLKNVKITTLHRKETSPLGNGSSLLDYRHYFDNDPFLVLWGDSFALRKHDRVRNMIALYNKLQKPIICLLPFFERARYLYAIPKVKHHPNNLLTVHRIFEKPGNKKIESDYAFANGYLLEPDIFPYLYNAKPSNKGEIVLEDAIDSYCKKNLVYGMVFNEPFFEAGNKYDLVKSTLNIMRHREDLQDFYNQLLIEMRKEAITQNE